MTTEGHCNCKSVTVKVPALKESIVCYCSNCRRAGASLCSLNYLLDSSEVDISDPNGTIRSYSDSNTRSGNTIIRKFCGTCGSPVATFTPDSPKVFVKAGLFDYLAPPVMEVFEESKAPWAHVTKKE
ncbi:hypothetical protein K491DRAFT_605348 [Lophiostoma macrostomum CBS 122681]|uniref:CENP-V/GFA domain-containing protein n=1 Tax=Lophiostoma macrostomum CBS 122681 TaxID=1314788 RepID=A0A6A6SZ15_9PLEO|nr:hypothetical protein K491DRAFT_605348 [Lophiostoma macrostomum CBS 122681]